MSCNSFWILLDAMTLLAPERGDGERERCPLPARVPPASSRPPRARPHSSHQVARASRRPPLSVDGRGRFFAGLCVKQRTLSIFLDSS